MPALEWNEAASQNPPVKERLLLITAADDFPPNARMEGQSEVAVGYWTGNHFRYLLDDYQAGRVARWALLAPCLPTDIKLKRDRRLDPDVRG
jgi:hypothetical protein